jgi:hypothetical protein
MANTVEMMSNAMIYGNTTNLTSVLETVYITQSPFRVWLSDANDDV